MFTTLKNLGRLADIAAVLVRHGFSDLAERLDFPSRAGPRDKAGGREMAQGRPVWERIRLVAEELGPTYVKLGQLLSMRPDLLPRDLVKELRLLQDQVSPEESGVILEAVEASLGRPIPDVFSVFEPTPLASASLAQVHRAQRADDGRWVAVKVRRPGIEQKVHSDLDLLESVAASLHARVEALAPYNLPQLVETMREHLRREMNFASEAENMRTARANLPSTAEALIPEPHPDLTKPGLLTMELVEGKRLEEAGLTGGEKALLAKRLARLVLRQILVDGFFHADPHPGNFLVVPGEEGPRLALLDWGLVGRMTLEMRFIVADLVEAVVDRDSDRAVRGLVEMGAAPADADLTALSREVEELVDLVHSRPLSEIDLGALVMEMMETMRRHRIQVQVHYALLTKALLEMEGLARGLDPAFDPVEVARPFIGELWRERWSPTLILRYLRQETTDTLRLARGLPRRLDSILRQMEQGNLGLMFKHKGLEKLPRALQESSSRISVALILAALIMGSSMIVTTGAEPKLLGLPALGLVGYIISALVGLWLVWSILRSGGGKF